MTDETRQEMSFAMTENVAAELAAVYGAEQFTDFGWRTWQGTRFPGGWLMHPQGADLEWRTGVVCLAVLDDGAIYEDSSSVPPTELVQKYATIAAERGQTGAR